jgi:predicted HTH domain antitoxin
VTANVTIEIPREIAHAARMTPQALKEELALALYANDKLSFGKARELAGLTAWEFQERLGRRGIPVHYDLDAYEEDLNTLESLTFNLPTSNS